MLLTYVSTFGKSIVNNCNTYGFTLFIFGCALSVFGTLGEAITDYTGYLEYLKQVYKEKKSNLEKYLTEEKVGKKEEDTLNLLF
jgi:hypothetical protein